MITQLLAIAVTLATVYLLLRFRHWLGERSPKAHCVYLTRFEGDRRDHDSQGPAESASSENWPTELEITFGYSSSTSNLDESEEVEPTGGPLSHKGPKICRVAGQ